MAALKRTVLAGGVIYAAGTQETDELREIIGADDWTDAPGKPGGNGPATVTVDVTAVVAELDELRTLAAQEIEAREEKLTEATAEISRLTAELDRLTVENAELVAKAADTGTPPAATKRKPGPAPASN